MTDLMLTLLYKYHITLHTIYFLPMELWGSKKRNETFEACCKTVSYHHHEITEQKNNLKARTIF